MNHIATVESSASGENYSLLIIGDGNIDEDGGVVDGDAFRGHFPVPAACRNRDFCPPNLVFGGGGATDLFVDGGGLF